MIVIVLGMHRSGTSAMAGLLHSNGISMGRKSKGEFFPPPQIQNPKGFYENRRFRTINDGILRHVDYNVKTFEPEIPKVNSCFIFKNEMMNLIMEYEHDFDYWGWKDPRTCLTLSCWMEVIRELQLEEKTKFIVMRRRYDDIVKSMITRNNKEQRPQQFCDLCESYYKSVFDVDFNLGETHLVYFDSLLNDTEAVCDSLSSFLEYEISDTSFIDPSISGMHPQNRKRMLRDLFGARADGRPREELLNAARTDTSNDTV